MLLYDMIKYVPYDNKVNIYLGSAYDYNFLVFSGTIENAREDESVFQHLTDKVDHYDYKTGEMVIIVRNEEYNQRPENIYVDKEPEYWNPISPKEKRQWRTLFEIEKEMESKKESYRYGYWVNDGKSSWDECSECGARIETCDLNGEVLPKNFCPECGAKMSGWKSKENEK